MPKKISSYDILNVKPNSSISEIKKAYREQLKKWHPDINKSRKAPERTRKIIEAWQVLQDSKKRAFYDSTLSGRRGRKYRRASWATSVREYAKSEAKRPLGELLKEIGGETIWILTWSTAIVIIALIAFLWLRVYEQIPLLGNILILVVLLSPFIITYFLVKRAGFGTCFLFVFLAFTLFVVIKKIPRRVIMIDGEITNVDQNIKRALEVRICIEDGVNVRKGPGPEYEIEYQLLEGEKLYILEEKNGWIRFRVTTQDLGWSGWVEKTSTASLK